ncbi:protein disulfide oxidoreductase [Methylomonas sp. SURF-2]|uniref:Protein disulfide oxidoreductase n=1 Tax=Methylomonas subterranea TaxID=2952225 RepID=A0ABT1TFI2_9GAMM|nr:protein disulfide oxidoreductase [Methylomonas sp. SURF-2]MCQ8103832.1 protein disulfide oxidoreductase [Methylomonas sp. SURF-2]
MMPGKAGFYFFALLFVFGGQFLRTSGLVTGMPPEIRTATLSGQPSMPLIAKGPAMVYFWAEWCGVCRGMQDNVTAVLHDTAGLTVALRSGDKPRLAEYLDNNKLDWPVVDDRDGAIGQLYGVSAVPALFFLNRQGRIVFTSSGYTSEWGLRLRLWLAGLL